MNFKFNEKEYGMIAILVVLLMYFLNIRRIVYMLYSFENLSVLFSPFVISLVLATLAIAFVFIKHKYSWIVIYLPFLYKILSPFRIEYSLGNREGILFMMFNSLAKLDIIGFTASFFNIIPLIAILFYLIAKNVIGAKGRKFEIYSAVIILLTYFLLNYIFRVLMF
jgi:hypothetical protein